MIAPNRIKKVGVAGAGTMGAGIAHLFALRDFSVTVVDRDEILTRRAKERIAKRVEPEREDEIFGKIKFSTKLEDLAPSQIVVEAVFEDERAKKEIFKTLGGLCGSQTILATNTSSISINSLAEQVGHPERVIGMHFMNPPVVMKLIEIVRGGRTSRETVETVTGLARALGKVPAVVNDSPGFVSNRLLFSLVAEAVRLLENGVAEKEDIDAVMRYGMNHPMGPIALADFIGLDVCRDILAYLHGNLGDEKFRPPSILEDLVKMGKLGKKSGEGFYRYS